MSKQSVNIGTSVGSGDGDPLRSAFDKLNDNINEIYALLGNGTTLSISGDVSMSAGAVTIADDAVENAMIADSAVDTDQLAADAVTGAKIADDAIDSEHYTDGSIDTAHIGALQVTGAKIAADAIDGTKIADDAIDSEHYTDASIDLAHLAADSVDGSKIADDSIDSEHYVDGSIDTAHIANDQITHDKLSGAYTLAETISTTSGTINLDASSYSVFRFTSDLTGATTLNIQNMKEGQAIDILLSGSQTVTFSSDDTTETFNKVGGVDYDGAEDNHIQVICIEDLDSGAIYNYTIGTYTSDSTP